MTCTSRGPVLRELGHLFRHGTLCGLGDEELLQQFLERRDAAAFEALVSLHGPMVLGICCRMLRDPRDVEDAFQATFLVLVQKAPVIRDRRLLASWLYGVAFRVARRARARAVRRHAREIGVESLDVYAGETRVSFAGTGPVLDQELNRLPAKYREPIVLCYLEGRTHDQAAEQLRCPVGTVRSRMARGRELLKRRLTRRGCAPIAGIAGGGAVLPPHLGFESVPASLAAATVRSALTRVSAGAAGAGSIGASVLTLTSGALTTMKLNQLGWIALATIATSLSASGVIAVAYAKAQTTGNRTAETTPSAKSAQPGGDSQSQPGARFASATTEGLYARLKALESKLDALLERFSTTTTIENKSVSTSSEARLALDALRNGTAKAGTATATASRAATVGGAGRPAEATDRPSEANTTGTLAGITGSAAVSRGAGPRPGTGAIDGQGSAGASGTVGSVRELELQLKLALEAFERADALYQRGRASDDDREQRRGKVLLAAAVLQGLDDDLADELDRLMLEIKKGMAELHQAEARRDAAETTVVRNKRLNERRSGTVGQEDAARADADLRVAEAQIEIKRVEIEELELRASTLKRRRGRIAQAVKMSERAVAADKPAAGSPAGVR
jgi:RNA polymerase sigma factor (sigma-70 family)